MARKKLPEPTSTIETFRDVRGYHLNNLVNSEPSCFNGFVEVVKYRVSVEVVEEPVEVIHARLEKLWRESANWHHHEPLTEAAKKYGYTFTGHRGQDRRK
jgi:hypothetical protein